MNAKKLLSLAMAGVMALSLSVSALAVEKQTSKDVTLDTATGTYNSSIDFTGSLNVPTVAVTIPSAGTVFVNPYRLEADINTATNAATTQDGVFSPIYGIESKTLVALDVGVYGTVTPNGDVVVKSTALPEADEDTPTAKEVFVYIEVDDAGGGTLDDGYTGIFQADPSKVTAEIESVLILTEDTDEVAKVLGTIPAAEDGDDDGAADAAKVATFRFGGQSQPYTTEPWVAADTVTANVVFNFVPAVQDVTGP